jgi:hypothetical protein
MVPFLTMTVRRGDDGVLTMTMRRGVEDGQKGMLMWQHFNIFGSHLRRTVGGVVVFP